MPTSVILIISDWMLHCRGSQAHAWVVRFSFLSVPFDCISRDQSSLRLCWQRQAFQGSPHLCMTQGLWNGNTFDRWMVSPPSLTQPSPVLPPLPSPAQRDGAGAATDAGEDEPRCGTGPGHHRASGAMNCRFIPASQVLSGAVHLLLKEKKDFGPAWSCSVRFNSLCWWCD